VLTLEERIRHLEGRLRREELADPRG
jgi:hypothetical protein